jgi:Ca2+-binding EF-hand superfamily protein
MKNFKSYMQCHKL